ncbi:sigma-70 family RNA polymerase sigma factor [Leptolyngbya sp. FACHB-36]|uniref:sigma-70 family RNA polymerase sigma factor n=1 Tax=Leptolyngbya sp. FACHB-36 TaxID=2692808 RepID=UPI001680A872|nr:sigma-70 family RNA polymerase sigma factor [Leptolyngbya sp. FACHB-36]MBD2019162.1 sigma-70 family RNA polymerase sigma factor [Leptolyngbya sp. FACHB-36]
MVAPSNTTERLWSRYKRAKAGKPAIAERNAVALRHINLVREIAHQMVDRCAESYEDLEQIGFCGLLKAVERFDPDRGIAFSSFAVPYIRGAIMHHLRDHFGHLKIPRRTYETKGRVQRTQKKMAALGREMDETQVAQKLGISETKWRWTAEATSRKPLVCLDEALHCQEASTTSTAEHQWVRSQLGRLANPYRDCLTERFFKDVSVESIAKLHGTNAAQVEFWINEGLQRLRAGHSEGVEIG